ncbi:hypothetical protein BC829DRAFT_424084 [Chytridium lagenaria]|nr:hypothetical protein BC829DRAFT_424084 [Chytridium lagenaria]
MISISGLEVGLDIRCSCSYDVNACLHKAALPHVKDLFYAVRNDDAIVAENHPYEIVKLMVIDGMIRYACSGKSGCQNKKGILKENRGCRHIKLLFTLEPLLKEFNKELIPFKAVKSDTSVSYKPIPPPLNHILPEEAYLTETLIFDHDRTSLSVLKLEPGSARCSCGYKISEGIEFSKCLRNATLFTHDESFQVLIEVSPCPVCKAQKRFSNCVGPDLTERGIFNKNNDTLYTHRIFDEFTEAMVQMQITFESFLKLLRPKYLYKSKLGVVKLPNKQSFTEVFSYIFISPYYFRLGLLFEFFRIYQNIFNAERVCEMATIVLYDGISVGYPQSKMTGTLRPPTITDHLSPICQDVRRIKGKQVIYLQQKTRSNIKAFCKHYRSELKKKGDFEQMAEDAISNIIISLPVELQWIIFQIIEVENTVQDRHCMRTVSSGHFYSSFHLSLKEFLKWQLFELDEKREALMNLRRYAPSIGLIVHHFINENRSIPQELCKVVEWIISRVDVVKEMDDWLENGSFYVVPRLRRRPKYPNLNEHVTEKLKRDGSSMTVQLVQSIIRRTIFLLEITTAKVPITAACEKSANKKMGNLRKAAGYMSERHALIFIQTFLGLANTCREARHGVTRIIQKFHNQYPVFPKHHYLAPLHRHQLILPLTLRQPNRGHHLMAQDQDLTPSRSFGCQIALQVEWIGSLSDAIQVASPFSFVGAIPVWFGNSVMTKHRIKTILFTGAIPVWFGDSVMTKHLTVLFVGAIPVWFGNSVMTKHRLNKTVLFVGAIPVWFGNSVMTKHRLNKTVLFVGAIPVWFGLFVMTKHRLIKTLLFVGAIPVWFGLFVMTKHRIKTILFTGAIPVWFGDSVMTKHLFNKTVLFVGAFPVWFGHSVMTEHCFIKTILFAGAIPVWFGDSVMTKHRLIKTILSVGALPVWFAIPVCFCHSITAKHCHFVRSTNAFFCVIKTKAALLFCAYPVPLFRSVIVSYWYLF